MNNIFQVDYRPDKKEIRINLPEEVWKNIDVIIMTRRFKEELVVEKQKEGENERKPWDVYFLDIAKMVATRSTCDRAHVGAVIVKDKRILATGYNGSLPGEPHCDDVGHLMVDNHCRRTIHAERNAIAQCYQMGLDPKGATMYVTHSPCPICRRLIDEAGIDRIVYDQEYGDETK